VRRRDNRCLRPSHSDPDFTLLKLAGCCDRAKQVALLKDEQPYVPGQHRSAIASCVDSPSVARLYIVWSFHTCSRSHPDHDPAHAPARDPGPCSRRMRQAGSQLPHGTAGKIYRRRRRRSCFDVTPCVRNPEVSHTASLSRGAALGPRRHLPLVCALARPRKRALARPRARMHVHYFRVQCGAVSTAADDAPPPSPPTPPRRYRKR
jgi:hypothetical protein